MSTDDRNALNVLGEHDKATATGDSNLARLTKYLRGLPSLNFSDKGRATICQRFGIEPEGLDTAIAATQQRHSNAPALELLRVIGRAIGHSHKTQRGAKLC
jgi:hypothetical protein